jgi:hypothetical protein
MRMLQKQEREKKTWKIKTGGNLPCNKARASSSLRKRRISSLLFYFAESCAKNKGVHHAKCNFVHGGQEVVGYYFVCLSDYYAMESRDNFVMKNALGPSGSICMSHL